MSYRDPTCTKTCANCGNEAIARQFGVSHSNITMIRQRKTWRRVP